MKLNELYIIKAMNHRRKHKVNIGKAIHQSTVGRKFNNQLGSSMMNDTYT